MSELSREEVYNLSDDDFRRMLNNLGKTNDESNNQQNIESDENQLNTNGKEDINVEEFKNEPIDTNNEDDTQDETNIKSEESNQVENYKINVNGNDINLSLDELLVLAPQALEINNKLKKFSPYEEVINALEENKITKDELNQLIEIRNGNNVAIKNLLDKHNISTTSITSIEENDSKNYKPKEYGRINPEDKFRQTLKTLENNPNFITMADYVNGLDENSHNLIIENPDVCKYLIQDIESGLFEEARNLAYKNKLLNPNKYNSDIHYYAEVIQNLQNSKSNKNTSKQSSTKQKNYNKDDARLTGSNSYSNTNPKEITSINDISEEDYQEFLKRTQHVY